MRTLSFAPALLLASLMSSPHPVLAGPSPDKAATPPGQVEREGTLEIHVEDHARGSRIRYHLVTARERLELRFGSLPRELRTGDRLRVRGVVTGAEMALGGEAGSVQTLANAATNGAFGEHRTLVMLVNFQDKVLEPYTTSAASTIVFGTTSDYDREASYGQTWLTGDVVGWFTLAMSSTVCDTTTLATQAKAAATAFGINLSAYNHYVYAFPSNACSWWGLGSVGGSPSQAWVNGTFNLTVVAHEMGHNFGIYHSRTLDCGADVICSGGTVDDYGDIIDVMGAATSAHFNAFHKERLGWLNYGSSPPITTVTTGGTYSLEPFETVSSSPKALKILKSVDPATGARTWYYVEFRQGIGFDAKLGNNANVSNGLVIRTGSEATGNSSYLLDMTPETTSWSDPALTVGRTFTDADAGVSITPLSVSSTGALVSVTMSDPPPPACTAAAPTISMTPAQSAGVAPGTTVQFTATVRNNDSSGCAASTFSFAPTTPAGWTSVFSSPSVTVAPGASATTQWNVTSPAGTGAGAYTVTATASDASSSPRSASASASYVVAAALTAQVSTDKASYLRGATVTMTAAVKSGGSAVSGAPVTFSIRKANGQTTTASATTDRNGNAIYKLRTRSKDPVGTWQVTATASSGGQTASATTSFAMQ